MKNLIPLAAALSSAAAAQTPVAGPPAVVPSLEAMRAIDLKAEMRTLSTWFPGVYDNHEQVARQSGHALMPKVETPFHRIHISVTALPVEGFGPNAFRWTEHWGNDTQTLARDEVMVASIDATANAIRLKRRRITGTPEQAEPLGNACDLLLRYEGGQLSGQTASPPCPARGGFSDLRLIIGPRFVWMKEEVRTKTGKTIWEMAPGTGFDWHQATRARQFSCDVFGDEKGEMANTRFIQKISLHEKGNSVPIAYAYAEGDSDDFGLNLGWFYIRCAVQKPA